MPNHEEEIDENDSCPGCGQDNYDELDTCANCQAVKTVCRICGYESWE